jgi:peptidyl-dipeptidase Dcp
MNPLLTEFDTAPFSKIKNRHFKPAFLEAIEHARAEINHITSNSDAPTFENTIEALEFSGRQLVRISSIFFNLNSDENNDEIHEIALEVSPLLTEFSNDITLNEALFKRVKAVYDM